MIVVPVRPMQAVVVRVIMPWNGGRGAIAPSEAWMRDMRAICDAS